MEIQKFMMKVIIINYAKKTFGELYLNTLEKELKLITMGYKLKKIWDSEWIKINKSIAILQKKFKKCSK